MKRLEEIKALREKTDRELEEELAGARQDMFKFRTDLAMRSLANVRSLRSTRRKIARIYTLARERENAANKGG